MFERMNDASQSGWSMFVHRYGPVIHRWCIRKGLQSANADDLTQSVLIKLFDVLPRHAHDPDRGRFRSWLKTVVSNAVTDHSRGIAARRELLQAADQIDERSALPVADDALTSELEGMASLDPHLVDAVDRVQAKVKERTWEAFQRRTVFLAPAEVVAADLELSIAAVYQAEYRVGKMLKEEYVKLRPTTADVALPTNTEKP